jgi:hypothetical protein
VVVLRFVKNQLFRIMHMCTIELILYNSDNLSTEFESLARLSTALFRKACLTRGRNGALFVIW